MNITMTKEGVPVVRFEQVDGTPYEISAMEVIGCGAADVTTPIESRKRSFLGRRKKTIEITTKVGTFILKSCTIATNSNPSEVSEIFGKILAAQETFRSARSAKLSDSVVAEIRNCGDLSRTAMDRCSKGIAEAQKVYAEIRGRIAAIEGSVGNCSNVAAIAKSKASLVDAEFYGLRTAVDRHEKTLSSALDNAKKEFDAYWHQRVRPWFVSIKRNERSLEKAVEKALCLEDRVANLEKALVSAPVDGLCKEATNGLGSAMGSCGTSDADSQPSLFDQDVEAGVESRLEVKAAADTDGVACVSPVEAEEKLHEVLVAGFDETRPDAFPLLMTTYETAMYRLGKLERVPDSENGAIHYNMLLWAIGYVGTNVESDIGWLRNKRASYSSQIAKFFTEKCGVEIVKFQKRIKFSDAAVIVCRLKELGCFTGSMEHSFMVKEGCHRSRRAAVSE